MRPPHILIRQPPPNPAAPSTAVRMPLSAPYSPAAAPFVTIRPSDPTPPSSSAVRSAAASAGVCPGPDAITRSVQPMSSAASGSIESYNPETLASQWKQKIQPISSAACERARNHVIDKFAEIVAHRKKTMKNCDDRSKWSGFFYIHEVCPVYRDDRIPKRLQALYNSKLVNEIHSEQFDLDKIKWNELNMQRLIEKIHQNNPVRIDCGGMTSLLQMFAYRSISGDKIEMNSRFLGFPPASMGYIIGKAYDETPNPTPRIDWDNCESTQDPIKPLDMCYLWNDARYLEYNESSQGDAFHTKDWGAVGRGWWLTYVGNNREGEELYIGFGGDDGPATLKEWKEQLKREFLERWGEMPADWSCKETYYTSPLQQLLT